MNRLQLRLPICSGLACALIWASTASAGFVNMTELRRPAEIGETGVIAEGDHFQIWETRLDDPHPNARAFLIQAAVRGLRTAQGPLDVPVADVSDFIKNFDQFRIANVHQVWGPAGDSPNTEFGFAWAPEYTQYDSHLLFVDTDAAFGDPRETNDNSNPLNLDLPLFFGNPPIVGNGEIIWGEEVTDAFSVQGRDQVVDLARVVIADNPNGTAHLNTGSIQFRAIGVRGGGNAEETNPLMATIGGNSVIIPEPISVVMLQLAVVGMLACYRRRD